MEEERIPEMRKKYEKVATQNRLAPINSRIRSAGDRRERYGILLMMPPTPAAGPRTRRGMLERWICTMIV